MAKAKPEPTVDEQEKIVLEDNQLVCLLTGDIKASKPKEETLQSVIRMLNEEYAFDILVRISTHPINRINELLPHIWCKQRSKVEVV